MRAVSAVRAAWGPAWSRSCGAGRVTTEQRRKPFPRPTDRHSLDPQTMNAPAPAPSDELASRIPDEWLGRCSLPSPRRVARESSCVCVGDTSYRIHHL